MKVELPIASLPQTIQDTITMTRKPGFQYLWIDSLYILQDDPQDIATEIAKIGTVYKYTTLKIAAAAAKSVKDRFLGYRVPLKAVRLLHHLQSRSFGPISYILNNKPTSSKSLYCRV